jgi:hypothetical protein
MWRRRALFTTIAILAVVATACGGGQKPKVRTLPAEAASASQVESTTTTAVAAKTATKPAVHNATPALASTATPTPASNDGQVVSMPSWFTVTVDKSCVHAQDTQTFTVHGGMPGQLLIYDTAYANGTDNYTSHYGTGSGQAKFDANGNYNTSFVLAGNVPSGTTYLSVATSKGGQIVQGRTTFLIKPVTDHCP